MTQNQIAYWQLQETRLQNLRQINETTRHNKALEAQNQYQLEEQRRHNLEQEVIGIEQAKASLAGAAAAQAQAAAAHRQAAVREGELRQQIWVDQQVQSRQDLLASSEVKVKEADVRKSDAQTLLIGAQTLTEVARTDLVTAQTTEAKSNVAYNYGKIGVDYMTALGNLVKNIAVSFG